VLRDHSARLAFLELQYLVYNTKALNLERHAPHGHFSDSTEVPFKKVGELGKGGFGYVDRVVSTISHQEYARKLILRGRTFKKDKQVLRDFTKELSNLKQLSHKHLVELVGSYTDKKFVAIVMLPVADTNLQTFLERKDLDERSRSLLRPFFGCLTSALCYLHDNRIRHKDIKPSNVLIKGDQVYFTDFGTALDWSDRGSSITSTAAPTTPRYCAPEVMAYDQRSSSSDIWSFGCVFLEMWTVLRSRTLEDLRTHMASHGSGAREYHSNLEAITGWIEILRCCSGPSSDMIPSTWIANMVQQKPTDRWNIHTLDNRMGEACVDTSVQHMFKGMCCLEPEDDLSEDTLSSAEGGEDLSTARSQLQHTHEPTRANTPEVPDFGQIVPTVVSKDENEVAFLGRIHQSAGFESDWLAHDVSATKEREPAEDFEDISRNPTGYPVIDRYELFLPNPHSLGSSAGFAGNENRLETGIIYGIPPSPGLVDDEDATPPLPNRSKSPVCHWDVAFEHEDDDVTDDETLHLHEATGEYASHPLVPHPLHTHQRELVRNFEMHALDCGYCKDPLDVFRRHEKLCAEGLRLAKRLLTRVSRSNGRVYGVRMDNRQRDAVDRKILQVVSIPQSYGQVNALLKAVERSKRCSGNYVFLARYCDNPEHRYWQELYPCPWCKKPLGPQTRRLISNGELVHKRCDRFIVNGFGDEASEDKKQQPHPYQTDVIRRSRYRVPGYESDHEDLVKIQRNASSYERPRPEKTGFRSLIGDFIKDALLNNNYERVHSTKNGKRKGKKREKRLTASPALSVDSLSLNPRPSASGTNRRVTDPRLKTDTRRFASAEEEAGSYRRETVADYFRRKEV
jgi:serine/threonine protein kinase